MRDDRRRAILWSGALAAAVWAAFFPSLDNGFVNWDDHVNIVRNPWLGRFDLDGWVWIFRTTLLGHFQPLSWLSLSIDKALWGAEAGGFHATALVLHAASAILLFLFLRALLRRERFDDSLASPAAAASSALFALHPLRVESVAWATERRDVLSLFFLLLSCLLYLRAVDRDDQHPRLGPALAAFAAAAFSKVVVFVVPAMLLCLDRGLLRRKRSLRELIEEKGGFWVIGATVLALGIRAQTISGATTSFQTVGLLRRLSIAAWTPGWVVWKTLLPTNLSAFVFVQWRSEPWRYWPLVALTLLVTVAVVASRSRRVFFLGAAWFLALFPALGLFKSGSQSAADRFSLIPATVLSVGVAFLFARLGRRALWTCLPLSVLLAAMTRLQTLIWRDSVTLWKQAASAGPPTARGAFNLELSMREAGLRTGANLPDVSLGVHVDAASYVSKALKGSAFYEKGDWQTASRFYARSLALDPYMTLVRVNFGLCLYRLGRIPEAAEQFARAAEDDPGLADAWHNLGIALARLGRFEEADRCILRALLLAPQRQDSRQARIKLRRILDVK